VCGVSSLLVAAARAPLMHSLSLHHALSKVSFLWGDARPGTDDSGLGGMEAHVFGLLIVGIIGQGTVGIPVPGSWACLVLGRVAAAGFFVLACL
jgi:hypothetical protein